MQTSASRSDRRSRRSGSVTRALFLVARACALVVAISLIAAPVAQSQGSAALAKPPAPPAWSIEVLDWTEAGLYSHLVMGGDSTAHIAYRGDAQLKYATWTPASASTTPVDSEAPFGLALALDRSGLPAIAYGAQASDGTCCRLKLARWTGSAWNIEVVDGEGRPGFFTSLAFDAANRPLIAYFQDVGSNLKFARWTGSAWEIQTVDSGGTVGQWNSLVLDAAGNPHIAYTYLPVDGSSYYVRLARWQNGVWQIVTVTPGANPSLALDAAGLERISFTESPEGALKYASWNGKAWRIRTVDDSAAFTNNSLALVDGDPRISYYALEAADLKYASLKGGKWQIQTLDTAGDVGAYNSLGFNQGGLPRISYYDRDNRYLKIAAGEPPARR